MSSTHGCAALSAGLGVSYSARQRYTPRGDLPAVRDIGHRAGESAGHLPMALVLAVGAAFGFPYLMGKFANVFFGYRVHGFESSIGL